MKICHNKNIARGKSAKGLKYRVTLNFSQEQYGWLSKAAEEFTEGCVCDLVGNCFWEEFTRLTKEIADKVESQENADRAKPN